tara:strand:+ start:1749 stop:4499 length:2751 start_codon:yes stop_codon:yes gene_type:complete
MSVQLIVYPQNYDGFYNAMSASSTEFLANGITFTNLNNTGTYTSSLANPYADVLANAPPSIPNTWYRFRNGGFTPPDFPVESSNNLILKSIVSSGSVAGVYQRLTNLTAGVQYTITINLSAATTGIIITQIANGTNIYSGGGSAANVTQITDTFTAQSTAITVMVAYANTIVATSTITSISVQPVIGAINSGAIQVLGNGQVICDLYEDEDLPLTLSVDDFKNVAEKVQSYSKAFELPATKRNNRIFDQIFEITREVASSGALLFNPYTRTQCVLKQDGFILFEGYLRLLDITDKEGEISYNVNLYSEVVAFADVLQDRTFRDLDFTELEHNYNKTEINNSWNDGVTAGQTTPITWTNSNTSGYRTDFDTLKYPFVDWTHQILVGGASGTAANSGNPELTTLETAFRPFISIKYLIDRIFQATNFTYESTFFNTTDFKKLYMDFNWGGDTMPAPSNSYSGTWRKVGGLPASNVGTGVYKNLQLIPSNLSGGQPNSTLPPNYDTSTYTITATTDNELYNIAYNFKIENFGANPQEVVNCKWIHTVGGVVQPPINFQLIIVGTVSVYFGSLEIALNTGDTLQAQFDGSVNTRQSEFASGLSICTFVVSSIIASSAGLLTLRGEVGHWEFIKGLITMFNLVTLPDEDNPNNIKIEPYADVFVNSTDSVKLDWTEKIDVSEMKLTPLTDLNLSTLFKFVEDDDDYSFNQYKNLVGGHLYGSKKFNAGNAFNILKGKDEIIAEPFAATVVKPLMSQFPQFITPAIYALNEDGSTEGFENSPRIMFNNGIKDTGATYYIPAQNGVTSSNETEFLQFSHLTDIPTSSATPSTTIDFHFGECQLMTGVGVATVNNLFNLYWLPYYNELYNPNTRIMTINVNLSPADINTFKFNDTVYLKNRLFRVNKIDYKPNDLATVEFILIP